MTVKKFEIYLDIREEKDCEPIIYTTQTSLFNEGHVNTALKDFSRKLEVEIYNILTPSAYSKFYGITGCSLTKEMKLNYNKIAFIRAVIQPATINDLITKDLEVEEIVKLAKDKTFVVFQTDNNILSRKLSSLSAVLPFQLLAERDGIYIHCHNYDKLETIKYRLYLNNKLLVERYFPILPDNKILVEEVDINCTNLQSLDLTINGNNLEFVKVVVDHQDFKPLSNKFSLQLE